MLTDSIMDSIPSSVDTRFHRKAPSSAPASSSFDTRTHRKVPSSAPAPITLPPPIRTGWFWIAGVSGFCLSIYCTAVFLGWRAAWKKSQELDFEQDADVSNRYDKIATRYDEDIDWMEKVMRLDGKRKKLCEQVKGHVLEASVGTGRNGKFYDLGTFGEGGEAGRRRKSKDWRIKSMTFVDQSKKMLEICSKRWKEQHPKFRGQVEFVVADAGAKGAINPPPGSGGFDTIIQTFGLCSMTDPVEYMRTMSDLLKKPGTNGAEGGRILLLEHGRGHYWWINYVLDGLAKEHADRFGCWWNRDIGKIVQDSGLKIVGLKRYHFGTTWALQLTHVDADDVVDKESKKTS
jgi:methyltransferase OMS1, mitochondrial